MRSNVLDAFWDLTVAWEGGYINWMFPDIKGLVSTGFGLLLDPVAMALTLPWRRADGGLATRDEIVADFARVKAHPDAARLGHKSVERVAQLRLTKEDLRKAYEAKVRHNESVLRSYFADAYDEWPADAELGVHSMAWACGPAFASPSAGRNHWPKLTAALRALDFETAAIECFMDEEAANPGIRPRNKGNRIMFRNALASHRAHLDPDVLFYPRDLDAQPWTSEEDTQPNAVPEMRPDPLEARTVVDFPIVHPWHYSDDEPPDDAA